MRRIKGYGEYITEMVLNMSEDLAKVINSMGNDKVARAVLLSTGRDFDKLRQTELTPDFSNPGMLKFASKEDGEAKQSVAIGKLVNAIKSASDYEQKEYDAKNHFDGITEEDIYKFVVKLKGMLKHPMETSDKIEIVKGDEIKKYYLGANYDADPESDLGKSCMRKSSCQPYFDIYVENTDTISLLILRSTENPEKIKGRAILWSGVDAIEYSREVVDPNVMFMDRVYTDKEEDVMAFKAWANKNGAYYKEDQDNSESFVPMKAGRPAEGIEGFVVKVKKPIHENYPYMDTMKYMYDGGIISNKDDLGDIEPIFIMEESDGGVARCNGCGGGQGDECEYCDKGYIDCPDCGGSGSNECTRCESSGYVDCVTCDGRGEKTCPECGGSGEDGDETCDHCGGDGDVTCEECGGDGKDYCPECGGDGEHNCFSCDGIGRDYCPECGGDHISTCRVCGRG